MTPPLTETEASLQSALNDSALDDVILHMERESDGHTITLTKGAPNARYLSSSTVKPIACAAMLWGEHKGWAARDSLVVDLVPEFSALATSEQRNITLAHLMSFTSGLFASNNPSNAADWDEFVDNCASLATIAGDPDLVPGSKHVYATDQHALASVAAVNASPYADWDEYFTAFIADTGLFPGATWNNHAGLIFGGNVAILYTAPEYAAFLRAIFSETVLSPALCQDLYADAIEGVPDRTSSYALIEAVGEPGEDWHFGRGIWLEQRNADWVPAEGSTRIASVGNGSQYCYHDLVTGVTMIVSVTFGATMDGWKFGRSLDALVATWGSE